MVYIWIMKTIAIIILLAFGGLYFYLDYKADNAKPYGLNSEAEASYQQELERIHNAQDGLDSSNSVLAKEIIKQKSQ